MLNLNFNNTTSNTANSTNAATALNTMNTMNMANLSTIDSNSREVKPEISPQILSATTEEEENEPTKEEEEEEKKEIELDGIELLADNKSNNNNHERAESNSKLKKAVRFDPKDGVLDDMKDNKMS